ERLQRRNVDDRGFVGKAALHAAPDERVDGREEGSERLARARGRGDERMPAGLDRRPGLQLCSRGSAEAPVKPCRNGGMEGVRAQGYWPVDSARSRMRPTRLSVNGAGTPAFLATSSVPVSRPSISSDLPASMSCSVEGLKAPRRRAMSMRASGSMAAS